MPTENHIVYCPRCDRMFPSMKKTREHVEKAHPDYDPLWADEDKLILNEEDK